MEARGDGGRNVGRACIGGWRSATSCGALSCSCGLGFGSRFTNTGRLMRILTSPGSFPPAKSRRFNHFFAPLGAGKPRLPEREPCGYLPYAQPLHLWVGIRGEGDNWLARNSQPYAEGHVNQKLVGVIPGCPTRHEVNRSRHRQVREPGAGVGGPRR